MIPDANPDLPQHVAIIMDGNNRWASARNLSGAAGHREGAEAAKRIVNACLQLNINYLTLFAFSSENWLRPKKEVQGLMALFLAVLKRREIQQFHDKNVKLQFIGNRSSFSQKLQDHMRQVEELTADNTGMTVTVAADYGGRWDIVNATKQIAEKVADGSLDINAIDAGTLQEHICLGNIPEPDLCIRTGGENRISNFLLWQFAYTELYFTESFWPDFEDQHFQVALQDFASRQRRFGHYTKKEAAG